jgi:hypothetical protein
MAITNALNSKTFNEVLLKSKPVEQWMSEDGGVGQAVFGKVTKRKAWGRTNLVPVKMSDSYEFKLFSETYNTFATGGGRSDKLMNVTPISQTARIRISGFLMTRLLNSSGSDYILNKQDIVNDFKRQLKNIMIRQFMSSKTGVLCYINNGTSTTQYLYGLNGALLPSNHILWGMLSTSKTWDIVNASTGAVLDNDWAMSSIDPSTSSVVGTSVATGATVTTYGLRPHSDTGSDTVAQVNLSGRLDIISDTAAYGVDDSAASLTSATDHNWRSEVKDFGGVTLDEEVMEYLVASCWGDKSSLVAVADPMVIAKAFKDMSAKKTFNRPSDPAVLGFTNLVYANGGREIPIVSSDWMRGSQQIDLINTDHVNYMGTLLEPTFARPDFQLLEDSYDWINDIVLHGEIYTDMRHAHARGTTLAKSSY